MTSGAAVPQGSRVALVGAAGLLGREIRDRLAASGVPGDAVTLFDLEEVAGLLTEYGEEARVFAETVIEDVLEHELICFCGASALAAEHFEAIAGSRRLGVDCTGAWLDRSETFGWIPGVSDPPSPNQNRIVAIPDGSTVLLATALTALGEAAAGAIATLFIPASDRDEAGLQEMSQQSMAVLNLDQLDVKVFGRQRAFDLWPPPGADADPRHPAAVLRRLGIPAPALQLVAAPVFHGAALSIFVPGAEAAVVDAALRAAGVHVAVEGADGPIDSPVRTTGTTGLHTIGARSDTEGTWVWATLDNLQARAAAAVTAINLMSGWGHGAVSPVLQ